MTARPHQDREYGPLSRRRRRGRAPPGGKHGRVEVEPAHPLGVKPAQTTNLRPSRSFQGAGSPLECRRSATHQPQRKPVRRQQAPSRVQPLMALYISGMEAAVSCRSSSGRDAAHASCSRILLHYCTERFTTVSSLRAQAVSLGNVGSIVPIRPSGHWSRRHPVNSAVRSMRISLVGAVEGVRKSRHYRPRSKLTVEVHLDTIRESFR